MRVLSPGPWGYHRGTWFRIAHTSAILQRVSVNCPNRWRKASSKKKYMFSRFCAPRGVGCGKIGFPKSRLWQPLEYAWKRLTFYVFAPAVARGKPLPHMGLDLPGETTWLPVPCRTPARRAIEGSKRCSVSRGEHHSVGVLHIGISFFMTVLSCDAAYKLSRSELFSFASGIKPAKTCCALSEVNGAICKHLTKTHGSDF